MGFFGNTKRWIINFIRNHPIISIVLMIVVLLIVLTIIVIIIIVTFGTALIAGLLIYLVVSRSKSKPKGSKPKGSKPKKEDEPKLPKNTKKFLKKYDMTLEDLKEFNKKKYGYQQNVKKEIIEYVSTSKGEMAIVKPKLSKEQKKFLEEQKKTKKRVKDINDSLQKRIKKRVMVDFEKKLLSTSTIDPKFVKKTKKISNKIDDIRDDILDNMVTIKMNDKEINDELKKMEKINPEDYKQSNIKKVKTLTDKNVKLNKNLKKDIKDFKTLGKITSDPLTKIKKESKKNIIHNEKIINKLSEIRKLQPRLNLINKKLNRKKLLLVNAKKKKDIKIRKKLIIKINGIIKSLENERSQIKIKIKNINDSIKKL